VIADLAGIKNQQSTIKNQQSAFARWGLIWLSVKIRFFRFKPTEMKNDKIIIKIK